MNTEQSAGSTPFWALIGGRAGGGVGGENEQDESNAFDTAGPICHQSWLILTSALKHRLLKYFLPSNPVKTLEERSQCK